jgi:hypothetical protein
MAWGWNTFVTNVPNSRPVYGPVGTPAPVPEPFPAGPASAGPVVDTPLQWSGGRSANGIDPYASRRRVQLEAPVQWSDARVQPFDYQGVMEAGAASTNTTAPNTSSIGNPIIIVPPCNPHTTPLIRPPKFITPQLAQAGTQAAVRSASFARGGRPRSVQTPEGIATPAPVVVTRWSVYG